jgi:hypothetical protein
VKHVGPSTIRIDTLYKSGGNIPPIFLRGAGVPSNFIDYIGSLVGKPIEFNSCFISYSTKDQPFADGSMLIYKRKGSAAGLHLIKCPGAGYFPVFPRMGNNRNRGI